MNLNRDNPPDADAPCNSKSTCPSAYLHWYRTGYLATTRSNDRIYCSFCKYDLTNIISLLRLPTKNTSESPIK